MAERSLQAPDRATSRPSTRPRFDPARGSGMPACGPDTISLGAFSSTSRASRSRRSNRGERRRDGARRSRAARHRPGVRQAQSCSRLPSLGSQAGERSTPGRSASSTMTHRVESDHSSPEVREIGPRSTTPQPRIFATASRDSMVTTEIAGSDWVAAATRRCTDRAGDEGSSGRRLAASSAIRDVRKGHNGDTNGVSEPERPEPGRTWSPSCRRDAAACAGSAAEADP